jgi:hypothetical protein
MKELILEILKEYSSNKKSEIFPLTNKQTEELINKQYQKCDGTNYNLGCIKKLTDDNCNTSLGVVGGYYTEKIVFGDKKLSDWSVVNRFDSNSKVKDKIKELYDQDENENKTDFKNWIINNSQKLFNGEYTKLLVDENKKTLEKGYQGESFARTIIQKIYPKATIKQHCAGDIRDRKLGQDFDVIIDNINYYFQIKTIKSEDIEKYNSERGYYYSIPSYYPSSKYKESNVDVIMYVDIDKNPKKYVLFNNDYSKIVTVHRPKYHQNMPGFNIVYYEEPLETNIEFEEKESEPNRIIKPSLSRSKELLIKQYQDKIKQLSQELDKLQKGNNSNQTTMFEDISQQLSINKKRLKRLIG